MKNFILLTTFMLLLVQPWLSYASEIAEFEAREIENAIRTRLSAYLEPAQYLLVVHPKAGGKPKEADAAQSLPGLPGADTRSSAFIDTEGRMMMGSKSHHPMTVSLVLDHSVPGELAQVFRNQLPGLAGLDTKGGDEIKVTMGRLGRPPLPDVKQQQPNWIDSLMKFRRELIALGLGFVGSIAVLLILHGLMSAFARSRPTRTEVKGDGNKMRPHTPGHPQYRPEDKSAGKNENNEHKNGRMGRFTSGQLNRSQFYSRDAILFETIREISEQAEKHPDRLAKLMTAWIQQGGEKITAAATLINNFGMKESEVIMSHMVGTDVDQLKPYLGLSFDPFTDENFKVMMEARQGILRMSATSNEHETRADFKFLTELGEDTLKDILRYQPMDVVVMVATQVPPHRLNSYLASQPANYIPEFFGAFCKFENAPDTEWERVATMLKEKLTRIYGAALSEKEKSATVKSLINRIQNPNLHKEILERVATANPEIGRELSDSLILFEDVLAFSERALRIILLELDVFLVLKAMSRSEDTALKRIEACLPKASLEIYMFERQAGRWYADQEVQAAQSDVIAHVSTLVQNGSLASSDVRPDRKWLQELTARPKSVA